MSHKTRKRCSSMVEWFGTKERCTSDVKKDGYCGWHHPDSVKHRAELKEKHEKEIYDRYAGQYCRRLKLTREQIGILAGEEF